MLSLSGGGHLRLEQFPGEEQCGTWFQYLTEPLTDCILVIVSQLQERLLRRQVSSCGLEISFLGAVTEDNQWHMTYHDRTILRLSDKFLRFTEMHTMAEAKMEKVDTTAIERLQPRAPHASDFREIFLYHLSDPRFCSHDAIGSRIDFSAGAATLYATCGGTYDTANFSCGASHLTAMDQNLSFSEGIQRLSLHVNAEEKEENEVPVVLCAADRFRRFRESVLIIVPIMQCYTRMRVWLRPEQNHIIFICIRWLILQRIVSATLTLPVPWHLHLAIIRRKWICKRCFCTRIITRIP